jgi:ankyrin repeat protein
MRRDSANPTLPAMEELASMQKLSGHVQNFPMSLVRTFLAIVLALVCLEGHGSMPPCSRTWESPLSNAVANRNLEEVKAEAARIQRPEGMRAMSEALIQTLDTQTTGCMSVRSSPDLFQYLIALGADLNYPNETVGGRFLVRAAELSALEMTRLALQAGANPNAPVKSDSPLMIAVRAGNQEMVELLLKAGAEPNLGGLQWGMSALAEAARLPGPNCSMIKTLTRHGAAYPHKFAVQPLEIFAKFYAGRPEDLDCALTLLLALGGKINEGRADPQRDGRRLESPLYYGVTSSHTSIHVLEALLRHGSDPNLFVLYALRNRQDYENLPLKRRDILELLFKYGARVSKTPKRNNMELRSYLLFYQGLSKTTSEYLRELDEMTLKYSP